MKTQLIDAGKSRRGNSYYAPYNVCNFQFRLNKEYKQPSSQPLLIGSLGHVVQAHHHAIEGIRVNGVVKVNGKDYTEDTFLDPMVALDAFCNIYPEHDPYHQLIKDTFANYSVNPPMLDTPVEVESELVGVVGRKNGEFGYWLVREDAWDMLDEEVSELPAWDGSTIKATPLGISDHPNTNKPIYLSRRLDLVTGVKSGGRTIIDHKHKQNIFGKNVGYIADMGFAAIWALGMQRWPLNLDNVEIHAISVNEKTKGKTRIMRLPYPKIRIKGLPYYLVETARGIAKKERSEARGLIDMYGWPMTGSSQVGGGCSSVFKDKKGWTCPHAYFCAGEEELERK